MAEIHPAPTGTRGAGAAGTGFLLQTDDRNQPAVDGTQGPREQEESRNRSIPPPGSLGKSNQESFSFHQLAAASTPATPAFTPGERSEGAAEVSRKLAR